jgi:hypothetical protein
MAKAPTGPLSTSPNAVVLQPPSSRREELLKALLANTKNPIHEQILKAYMASGTVEGAEIEFGKIIEEIVNED